MLRARLTPAVIGASFVLFAVGGCTEAGDEQSAPRSAEVAWADTVCGAVADGAAKVPQFPRLDSSDPDKIKRGFVEHVRTFSGAVGGVRDAVDGLGAPPVKNGKAVFTRTVGKLGKAVKSLDKAAAKLEKADAEDQQAMRKAMTDVQKAVKKTGTAKDLVKSMRANAELDKAIDGAPACREFAV